MSDNNAATHLWSVDSCLTDVRTKVSVLLSINASHFERCKVCNLSAIWVPNIPTYALGSSFWQALGFYLHKLPHKTASRSNVISSVCNLNVSLLSPQAKKVVVSVCLSLIEKSFVVLLSI